MESSNDSNSRLLALLSLDFRNLNFLFRKALVWRTRSAPDLLPPNLRPNNLVRR